MRHTEEINKTKALLLIPITKMIFEGI